MKQYRKKAPFQASLGLEKEFHKSLYKNNNEGKIPFIPRLIALTDLFCTNKLYLIKTFDTYLFLPALCLHLTVLRLNHHPQ